MKRITLKFVYRIMPDNMLLRISNNPSFSDLEVNIIGKELTRRFKTDEELENACNTILG